MIVIAALISCNGNTSGDQDQNKNPGSEEKPRDSDYEVPVEPSTLIYANDRFKDVTLEKTGEHTYTVKGKAQIFEANFGWVVEDGHEELKQGHQMTDAGAPEWGNFNFSFEVEKKRPESTLTLILFETSAEDGSRQHELTIPLN